MFFGERLKEARKARGYTLAHLGKISGINDKAISKYERGATMPAVENLLKLVTALDVSADYFLFPHAKMEGIPRVSSTELYDRYLALEQLSAEDQNAELILLDSLIAKDKVKKLVS